MRMEIDWIENTVNAAPEERATFAKFKIFLTSDNICRYLEGLSVVDHLSMPMSSVATALAHDWWTLFGGRDHEVKLFNQGNGYALPDLRLSFDGSVLTAASLQRVWTNPDVKFWNAGPELMSRAEGQAVLSKFIETVIERLNFEGIAGYETELRWNRICESMADPDEMAFCEAAGALGLDPYQIDDAAAERIENAASVFSGEPLIEFLAGVSKNNFEASMEWTKSVEKRPDYKCKISDINAVSREVNHGAAVDQGHLPYVIGYRKARKTRTVLNMGNSDRIETAKKLALRFGAGQRFETAGNVMGIKALREQHDDKVRIHLRNHGGDSKAAELFALSRTIGDVICFPDSQTAVVNDLKNASRQAASRAFAAEFLAPVSEILSMQEDGKDLIEIAREFSVSQTVIEHQIENSSRILAACT